MLRWLKWYDKKYSTPKFIKFQKEPCGAPLCHEVIITGSLRPLLIDNSRLLRIVSAFAFRNPLMRRWPRRTDPSRPLTSTLCRHTRRENYTLVLGIESTAVARIGRRYRNQTTSTGFSSTKPRLGTSWPSLYVLPLTANKTQSQQTEKNCFH